MYLFNRVFGSTPEVKNISDDEDISSIEETTQNGTEEKKDKTLDKNGTKDIQSNGLNGHVNGNGQLNGYTTPISETKDRSLKNKLIQEEEKIIRTPSDLSLIDIEDIKDLASSYNLSSIGKKFEIIGRILDHLPYFPSGDLTQFNNDELVDMCKGRDLVATGTKEALLFRIYDDLEGKNFKPINEKKKQSKKRKRESTLSDSVALKKKESLIVR